MEVLRTEVCCGGCSEVQSEQVDMEVLRCPGADVQMWNVVLRYAEGVLNRGNWIRC